MKLLVTGASGFLGRRVVAQALAAGHAVRAMVRPATNIDQLTWSSEVDIFRADLRGGVDLLPAFDGVDAVIHLAAGMDGTDEQRFQATVAGTERLLDAMARSRTRRLVLASSFYVYDWRQIRRKLTEESAIHATSDVCDGYTTAKVWQERVVRKMAERHGWELLVLRPGFIWGRGAELPPRVGVPVGRYMAVVGPWSDAALTHVDNCADYFVKAAVNSQLANQTLNVIDGHRVSSWSFTGQYFAHRNPNGWRIPIPYSGGFLLACMAKSVSRLIYGPKGRLPSLLVPQSFQKRFRPVKFSSEKLFQVLGEPQQSFGECVERTFGPALPERPQVFVADEGGRESADLAAELALRLPESTVPASATPLPVARSVVNER